MGIPATTYPYPSLFSLGNMTPKGEGFRLTPSPNLLMQLGAIGQLLFEHVAGARLLSLLSACLWRKGHSNRILVINNVGNPISPQNLMIRKNCLLRCGQKEVQFRLFPNPTSNAPNCVWELCRAYLLDSSHIFSIRCVRVLKTALRQCQQR